MKLNALGTGGLRVPEICLGTMTFGQQNTLDEACAQLDYALDHGVNFIDAAEMYPVPTRAETYGRTEEFIGHWLNTQARSKVILATKAAGPSRNRADVTWVRGEKPAFDRKDIQRGIENSLRRLQTDYIDLYQLHWPARNTPIFGQSLYDPAAERDSVALRETLDALAQAVKAGKVRHAGLSNETPWGAMQFLRLADKHKLPRVVSIQNAYNLINRVYEYGLSEIGYRESIGLLAYSPLAFGHLAGKYIDGIPPRSRLGEFPQFGQRYAKPAVAPAVTEYAALAKSLGLSLTALALAFVKSRWFVASTIIGATTLDQLKENIAAFDVTLDAATLEMIDKTHFKYTNPAP